MDYDDDDDEVVGMSSCGYREEGLRRNGGGGGGEGEMSLIWTIEHRDVSGDHSYWKNHKMWASSSNFASCLYRREREKEEREREYNICVYMWWSDLLTCRNTEAPS